MRVYGQKGREGIAEEGRLFFVITSNICVVAERASWDPKNVFQSIP